MYPTYHFIFTSLFMSFIKRYLDTYGLMGMGIFFHSDSLPFTPLSSASIDRALIHMNYNNQPFDE